MSLVLAKSYAGNLMSLLAVRYRPQPFQTLRDVVNAKHAIMIWQKYSNYERYLRVMYILKYFFNQDTAISIIFSIKIHLVTLTLLIKRRTRNSIKCQNIAFLV